MRLVMDLQVGLDEIAVICCVSVLMYIGYE